MTDEEIAAIATKLNEETQNANCVAKFVQHEGQVDPEVKHIVATRGGYLKLASLCLQAATYSD